MMNDTQCFWTRCSNRARCGAYGSCVAREQAGGKSWPFPVMDANLRRARAQAITAAILHEIKEFLPDDSHRMRHVTTQLLDFFIAAGAEVITDADRAMAGLQPRGPSGLTADELLALEKRRIDAMMGPAPLIMREKDK